MKIYRKREVVEEVETEQEDPIDAEYVVFNGEGKVVAVVRDDITDAWRAKE